MDGGVSGTVRVAGGGGWVNNLSYVRPDATASLVSTDEYLAPLVAHAQRGLGRTMAVSFPLGGEYSEKTRAWPNYGNFVQTVGRWLMGEELPPGLGLRHRLEGTRLTLDLLYDPAEWEQELSENPPRIKILESGNPKDYEVPWKRIAPGHFSVSRDLEEGSVIRGVIQAGSHAVAFGPLAVGSSAEWAFDPERLAELRLTSERSGGRELVNLREAWLQPPSTGQTRLHLPILLGLLGLLLLDALVTRTGWRFPVLGKMVRVKARPVTAGAKEVQLKAGKTEKKVITAIEEPKVVEEDLSERRSRFARAKRGK